MEDGCILISIKHMPTPLQMEKQRSDGHHEYPQGSEIMADILPLDAYCVSMYYLAGL